MASQWGEYLDESTGCTYYFNSVTGESTWERPPAMAQAPQRQRKNFGQAVAASGSSLAPESAQTDSRLEKRSLLRAQGVQGREISEVQGVRKERVDIDELVKQDEALRRAKEVEYATRPWTERLAGWIKRRQDEGELSKLVVFSLYIIINVILYIEASVRHAEGSENVDVPFKNTKVSLSGFFPVAKGFGQLLNFNCAFLLVPVSRGLVRRLHDITFFSKTLPLGKNIQMHKYIARFVFFASCVHGVCHYFNWATSSMQEFSGAGPYKNSWELPKGLTGNILMIVMLIMYNAAHDPVKRSNFEMFWYSHHFFILFYALLFYHGSVFWKWAIAPVIIYTLERVGREFFPHRLRVAEFSHEPPNILHVELEGMPSYRAGQYLFVNCPEIARFEWHPFTISSAPEDETTSMHMMMFHKGSWTRTLLEKLSANETTTLRIDGPHGAPSQHVWDYNTTVLVGAGIGATPFASILKSIIRYRWKFSNTSQPKNVYFYWIARRSALDMFNWFIQLLKELESEYDELKKRPEHVDKFLDIQLFLTGQFKMDQIKEIVDAEKRDRGVTDKERAAVPVSSASNVEIRREALMEELDHIDADDTGFFGDSYDMPDLKTVIDLKRKSMKVPKNYDPESSSSSNDVTTGLKNKLNPGRPEWGGIFDRIAKRHPGERIGVMFCGNPMISKQLARASKVFTNDDVSFHYHKENF